LSILITIGDVAGRVCGAQPRWNLSMIAMRPPQHGHGCAVGLDPFEQALAFSKSRQQFGRPIAEFQGPQWMLADMSVQLNAARLSIRCAAASANPFPDPLLAAQAKIFASEMAIKVTSDALQIFGARGY
jgi:alkylation response protein AidB-like acyl-CoA dehydrogenase